MTISYRRCSSGSPSLLGLSLNDYFSFTSFLRSEFSRRRLFMGGKISFFLPLSRSHASPEKNDFVESRRLADCGSVHGIAWVDFPPFPITQGCSGVGHPDCSRCKVDMVRAGCNHLRGKVKWRRVQAGRPLRVFCP